MEMAYDGALVMPGGCAFMDEEEMTYVEGGLGVFYEKSFSQTGKVAYKELTESGDAAWLLVGGATAGSAIAGIVTAVIGFALSSAVFGQWADTYYAAADSIYDLRKSSKKVKYTEKLSGLKAFLTVKFS